MPPFNSVSRSTAPNRQASASCGRVFSAATDNGSSSSQYNELCRIVSRHDGVVPLAAEIADRQMLADGGLRDTPVGEQQPPRDAAAVGAQGPSPAGFQIDERENRARAGR